MGKGHVEHFQETVIRRDERVIASVPGCLKKNGTLHRGALIATDQRVVFCRKGFFGSELVESIDFAKVSGMDRESSALSGRTISVHAAHGTLTFATDWKAKEAEQAFCAAVEQARAG